MQGDLHPKQPNPKVEPAEEVQATVPTPAPSPSPPPPTQQPLWDDLREEEEQAEKYSDELLPEAIDMVRHMGKASTSLLQRRFRIGYTRAARMMDVMEEDGIIGPHQRVPVKLVKCCLTKLTSHF